MTPDTSPAAVAELIAAAQDCIAAADQTAADLARALGLSERGAQALTDVICNGNRQDAAAWIAAHFGDDE